MIGTALAVGSGIASLIGSMKSAQENRKFDQQLQGRRSELQNWYDKEYNTNYLDTPEAKSLIQQLKDRLSTNNQGGVIRGASDEARIAEADAGQKSYSNALSRIAGYGTQYRDSIQRKYLAQKMNLDDLEAKNIARKSADWSTFADNAMNFGIGAAQAEGSGAFDKWDGKIANWRKSQVLGKLGGPINPVPIQHLTLPTFGK